ncbi:MAG TPA: hypothetical protein VGV36_08360, partial [Solirubrobacteraceae bacterium]|nr:hypothetical protein [Solirubrobacteraceae bacterium]
MSFKTRQYPTTMVGATLTRPPESGAAPAPPPEGADPERAGARVATWERAGLVGLALLALLGFAIYPTYPTYDSIYSIVWGRELLDGALLSFEAYRAPTQHPLAIAIGALLAPLGDVGARLWLALCIGSFVVLVAGLYTLGKRAFTPLVGAAAALLLLSRFDFAFLAARGYLDPIYLAMVIWAVVLEMRSRQSAGAPAGTSVLAILTLAGLLRPEAWLLAGAYLLWIAWPRAISWRRRAAWALLTASAPLVWVTTDFLVTGNPLFSFTGTSELAAELGRDKGLSAVPEALWAYLIELDKFPVVMAGILGLGLAAWIAPARLGMPLVLLGMGIATFAAVGAGGLSVISRYLLVPSLVMMVLAAVTVAGWSMLTPGRLRTAWIVGAVGIVLAGAAFTVTRVDPGRLDSELRFRGDWRAALAQVLQAPAVQAGLRCGPVGVPNHKLIPDVRWILDLPPGRVVARSDDATGRLDRGVLIIPHGRRALFSQALVSERDDVRDNLPLAGYRRVATSRHYGAYVRC